MNEAAATLGAPERLHPISLLASIAASARGMWSLFAAGGYFAVKGHWFLLVVTLLVYGVVAVGSALLRWSHFSFQVGEREIRIDSGLLSRTHRSLPFDRIQDVTIEQNPLWRAFGMARVRFETGASAGAGEDDGALSAISLKRAGEIRDLVRASRGLTPAAAPAGGSALEEAPVFAMDLRRVLTEGVFNFSLAVIGGLIGLSQTVGQSAGFNPFDVDFWEGLFGAGTPIGDYVLSHRLVSFVAGAILLVIVGLGTGLIRTLLRDYGFRLDRTAAGLRRRRGLMTVTDVVLPARRTQAAILASGPLRERFGWSELKLQSLAKEDGGKADHVVAPLADNGEIDEILSAIAWQPHAATGWRRVSKAYVWALAAALAPLFVLAFGLITIFSFLAGDDAARRVDLVFGPSLLLAAVVAVLAFRWLDWRRYAYALDGDRLLVRSGWWRRRLKILPLRNVQSVDYEQNFIDRRFGAANIILGVAGSGASGHGIKALPAQTARDIRDHLLSRFA